jgi:hypothetical protein
MKGKKKKKPSLFKHIGNRMKGMKISNSDDENAEQKAEQKQKRPYCKRCKKHGHATDDCFLWDQDKYTHCGKSNHLLDDYFYKDKLKEQIKKGKAKENPHKCSKTKEANTVDSDQSYATIEEVREVTPRGITFDALENGQFFNFTNNNVTDYSVNDESTLYFDWLADSVTTSHITNQCDTFVTYESIQDTLITGVGGLQAQAIGCGNVNICVTYGSVTYPIQYACATFSMSLTIETIFYLLDVG